MTGTPRDSNPSGGYSANLGVLARGQAGTSPRSLLIPAAVPTGRSGPPPPWGLPGFLCLAQQLRKMLEMPGAAPRASDEAKYQKGSGRSVG